VVSDTVVMENRDDSTEEIEDSDENFLSEAFNLIDTVSFVPGLPTPIPEQQRAQDRIIQWLGRNEGTIH
jgi:hypothetical protein